MIIDEQGRIAELASLRQRVRQEVARVVVGVDEIVDQLLTSLVVGGHVLLEGVPGTAKTTLAKVFAHVLGIDFHRVQFTPDLLPSDITGAFILDRRDNDFKLRQGPLFCQILLADEINRAPAKTQSALLEAMQERQATIEGVTLPLPRPFMVLATQNPVEQEGVYRLPEAQLDRFLLRVRMDYPSRETEVAILELHGGLVDGPLAVDEQGSVALPAPVTSTEALLASQSLISSVYVEPGVTRYIVDLSRSSREHPDLALGASPRASLYLLQCARASALLAGRQYATHEDVQRYLDPVLGHRLIMRPEADIEGRDVGQVLADLLDQVPVLRSAGP